MRRILPACAVVVLAACGGSADDPLQLPSAEAATAAVVAPRTVVLATGLASPWGLAFLPDGRLLVTQKGGRLVTLADGGRGAPTAVRGVPAVAAVGQGGLLGLAVDPDFARSPWVYLAFTEAGTGAESGLTGTAVARGRLVGDALQEVAVIFRQAPKVAAQVHYGARLAFGPDGLLYIATGERGQGAAAQDPSTAIGKVLRIRRDGAIPADNPAIAGGMPGLWSLGHRNPQGAALRPGTDELWVAEHGAQGGDELNRVRAGGNYGWPRVSYGCQYGDPVGTACAIGGGTHAPAYVEPVSTWVPTSIAPSGLAFYTGGVFPQWRGDAFIGALAGTALWRVSLSAAGVETGRERLFATLGERIRDVVQGPEGYLYLLTDSGKLIQVRD